MRRPAATLLLICHEKIKHFEDVLHAPQPNLQETTLCGTTCFDLIPIDTPV